MPFPLSFVLFSSYSISTHSFSRLFFFVFSLFSGSFFISCFLFFYLFYLCLSCSRLSLYAFLFLASLFLILLHDFACLVFLLLRLLLVISPPISRVSSVSVGARSASSSFYSAFGPSSRPVCLFPICLALGRSAALAFVQLFRHVWLLYGRCWSLLPLCLLSDHFHRSSFSDPVVLSGPFRCSFASVWATPATGRLFRLLRPLRLLLSGYSPAYPTAPTGVRPSSSLDAFVPIPFSHYDHSLVALRRALPPAFRLSMSLF